MRTGNPTSALAKPIRQDTPLPTLLLDYSPPSTLYPLEMSIAQNIATIRQDLPASVKLLAVTKQASVAQMREAYAVGVRDFGESRIQDAQTKQQELADLPDICWHLIGHLQGNKVRKALQLFDWIHSVDSLRLLQQIDRVATELVTTPNICLQVKVLPDPDKYGWTVPELLTDLPQIANCQQVNIRGLMAIPPLGLTSEQTTEFFDRVRELSQQINQQPGLNLQLSELSMGMSGDYRAAIVAGSTIIRPGSIIFKAKAA
jgi:PLP dependent protein